VGARGRKESLGRGRGLANAKTGRGLINISADGGGGKQDPLILFRVLGGGGVERGKPGEVWGEETTP